MLQREMGSEARGQLLCRLAKARRLTDSFFRMLTPEAMLRRPIPERHRLIFYLGHLEAFDWNLLGRWTLHLDPVHAGFDRLFAFGIDPVDGRLPQDEPGDWPAIAEIKSYNQRVREILDVRLGGEPWLGRPSLEDGQVVHVAIEHRLMHAETLAYLLHQVPFAEKFPAPANPLPALEPVNPRMLEISAGPLTLGLDPSPAEPFGWDNEFRAHQVDVPAFAIDAYPVTNGQYLEFVRAGGYEDRNLWSEAGWQWKERQGMSHPPFWVRRGAEWDSRGMFEEMPLPWDSPVYVSHVEASSYARWAGKALPTEAQWHRAAYGTPSGRERKFPWGDDEPHARHGNFDSHRWDATPVGAFPLGASAFGLRDLLGNGWEWTSTVFAPFPGFEPFEFYRGYSANFFDGQHFVMKGGGPRTAASLLRRSFRNWFQPHYPYVHAKFRCVEN